MIRLGRVLDLGAGCVVLWRFATVPPGIALGVLCLIVLLVVGA